GGLLLLSAAKDSQVDRQHHQARIPRAHAWTISVIIPTLNEEAAIQQCLQQLKQLGQQEGPLEVIVVDGGSEDKWVWTVALAAAAGAHQVLQLGQEARGRARQMNAGAAVAKGEVLLFLHADTCLPSGALTAVRQELSRPATVLLGFRTLIQGSNGGTLRWMTWHHLVKTWYCPMLLRPVAFTKGARFLFGDQVLSCRREDFDAVGGYDVRLPIMEDGDLCVRLHEAGPAPAAKHSYRGPGRVKQLLSHTAVTSGRRIEAWGSAWATFVHFRIGLGWYLGASGEELKQLYTRLYTDSYR
ncbi:hypothetical protein QJQ45_021164, partial [Haematococcus lacustris]